MQLKVVAEAETQSGNHNPRALSHEPLVLSDNHPLLTTTQGNFTTTQISGKIDSLLLRLLDQPFVLIDFISTRQSLLPPNTPCDPCTTGR